MNHSRLQLTIILTAVLATVATAGWEPVPTLTRIQSAAVSRGGKTVISLTGTGLDKVTGLVCSRSDVKLTVLPAESLEKPVSGANQPTPQRMNSRAPAPVTGVRVEVEVPARSLTGWCDVRAVTAGGASNPRRMLIVDGPVSVEVEPNNDPETAQLLRFGETVSGVLIGSNDVDYFRIEGRRGQKILAWLGTNSTDSKLPGAFEVFDSQGKMVASARDKAAEDAWADIVLPADGTYTVRVYSFGYVQGGPDGFYLLTLGVPSRVESVFPPIAASTRRDFVVYGRGLPGGTSVPGSVDGMEIARMRLEPKTGSMPSINPRAALLDLRAMRLPNGGDAIVAVSDTDPLEESADNDTPEKAMPLTLPALVAGRMEKAADRDWFQFEARKGEAVWLEVLGDRLGTDLDFMMVIKGDGESQGREIDEGAEPLHPQFFFNRSEDPGPFRFVPTRDGVYKVMVTARDGELEGGPHLVYALRVSAAKPDFRLVVIDGLGQFGAHRVKTGSAVSLLVLAGRHDGFDGPIDISIEGLPAGVRALPCRIPGGQKSANIVLEAQGVLNASNISYLKVVGTADMGGSLRKVERVAVPAGPIWPGNSGNNNPYAVRREESLVLTTSSENPVVRLSAEKKVHVVQQGDRLTLTWKMARDAMAKAPVQVSLPLNTQDASYRVVNGNNNALSIAPEKDRAEFQIEVRSNARASELAIVPRFQTTIPAVGPPPARGAQPRTMIIDDQGEPVTLIILPKRPLQVTVAGPARGRPGELVKLPIRIERQGFYGPVTLVSRDEGIRQVIGSDTTEAFLECKIPADVRLGGHRSITLQASCEVLTGRQVDQEVRLQFNLGRP